MGLIRYNVSSHTMEWSRNTRSEWSNQRCFWFEQQHFLRAVRYKNSDAAENQKWCIKYQLSGSIAYVPRERKTNVFTKKYIVQCVTLMKSVTWNIKWKHLNTIFRKETCYWRNARNRKADEHPIFGLKYDLIKAKFIN